MVVSIFTASSSLYNTDNNHDAAACHSIFTASRSLYYTPIITTATPRVRERAKLLFLLLRIRRERNGGWHLVCTRSKPHAHLRR